MITKRRPLHAALDQAFLATNNPFSAGETETQQVPSALGRTPARSYLPSGNFFDPVRDINYGVLWMEWSAPKIFLEWGAADSHISKVGKWEK